MIILTERTILFQGTNDEDDTWDYLRQLCWSILNILEGKERIRICVIISKVRTIISLVNNDGDYMCCYSRQLCQNIVIVTERMNV